MIKMNIIGGSNLSDADVTVNDVAYGKTIYDKTGLYSYCFDYRQYLG